MIELRDFDIGYIMGLVVGEGSFTHGKARGVFKPLLSMKLVAEDRAPLDLTAALIGGKVYGPYKPGDGWRQPYCSYLLRGEQLREAIPLFVRYLPRSRKRQQFIAWLDRHYHGMFYVETSKREPNTPSAQ